MESFQSRGEPLSETKPPGKSDCPLIPVFASLCSPVPVSATPEEVLHKFPSREICRGFIFALPASAPSVFPIGDLQLYGCLQRIPWQPAVKQQPGKHTLDGGMIPSFWNCYWVQEKNWWLEMLFLFWFKWRGHKKNYLVLFSFFNVFYLFIFLFIKVFKCIFYLSYFPSARKAF